MDNLDGDPQDRLVAGKREFGEFGGVNASVEISTTFTVLEADTLPAIFNGDVGPEKGGCYVYGRAFNPTVRHLGRLLAALEGCEAAYPCSSGMAAISATLMALCNTGDHIVASNTIYGGSHALLKTFLPTKAAITTTFVDITDLQAVRAALQAHPGRTKVVYTEVVSNPTLRVADLRALADLAHGSGAQLVVDNTFTPFVVTPRRFGADVVIHSLTKFVSGASDIIAGAICGSTALIRSLMDFHAGPCMLLGPTMDPRVASELSLRLPHLALRMQEHGRRAAAFSSRLAALGAAVTYPGLSSHPQQALMVAQANEGYGLGGLLGLDLGTPARANAFMERLQNRHGFGFMAVSLGYFDTLMSLSAASTSSELSDGDLATSGIGRGYVRVSVGITGSLEERWRQLEEAYDFATKLGPAGAVPYRAVKLRRNPSGSLEHLISWPSLGSFGAAGGSGGDDDAVEAATFEAALDEQLLQGGVVDVLEAEAAEIKARKVALEDDEDGSDVTSVAVVVTAAAQSPFGLAGAAPLPSPTGDGAGGGGGLPPPRVVLAGSAVKRDPQALTQNGANAAIIGGEAKRKGVGQWSMDSTSPKSASPLAAASVDDGDGGGPCADLGLERPAKIRRTGSSEVYYMAVQ